MYGRRSRGARGGLPWGAEPARWRGSHGRSRVQSAPYLTVKPLALMRWLVRLVTPPGGVVLDPFAGRGPTGIACSAAPRRFIGIDMKRTYAEMALARSETDRGAVEPEEIAG